MLLSKDPIRRPSPSRVLDHPFLSNKRYLVPCFTFSLLCFTSLHPSHMTLIVLSDINFLHVLPSCLALLRICIASHNTYFIESACCTIMYIITFIKPFIISTCESYYYYFTPSHRSVRLPGEEAIYDVFLSYRCGLILQFYLTVNRLVFSFLINHIRLNPVLRAMLLLASTIHPFIPP